MITQTDSAAQDVLEGDQKDLAATFATLDTIGEYNTAFMQLESGAVDAVACDLSIAQYQLAAKPDAYTQLDEPLSSEHYAVGFKKGDTKSADAVTESLKALYEDGTVKDLCDKYAELRSLLRQLGFEIAAPRHPILPFKPALAYISTRRSSFTANSGTGKPALTLGSLFCCCERELGLSIQVMMQMLGQGFLVSLQLFVLTLLGSIPLGIPVAFMRMSKIAPLRWIARIYISVMRGTPLMLQMFAIYFAPYYVFGISLTPDSKWTACVVAFIINYAGYFAEIYRSGLQSIPRGQYEAAEVLGYSRLQTFLYIVMPQVAKRILPAMGNEIITLVKDTSLAFAIGVGEMFSTAKALVASQVSMVPFAIAALIYWVFNFVVEMLLGAAEKKLDYYHD